MSNLRFGIDLDGVLANFVGEVIRTANKLWPGKLAFDYQPPDWNFSDAFTKEEWKQVWEELQKDPFLWMNIKTYIVNAANLETFIRTKPGWNADIYYITSRAVTIGPSVLYQSNAWLRDRGLTTNNTSVIAVPTHGGKRAIIQALQLPFFLDDYDKTVRELQDVPGLKAFLLDRPWNREAVDLPRVYSVEQYLKIVGESQ